MIRYIVSVAAVVCLMGASGCSTFKMIDKDAPLGAGGAGQALGADVVTSAQHQEAEGLMDDLWHGRSDRTGWNMDTRGKQLVYALVAESDLRCDRYLTAVSIDRNATRSSLDIVGLALGAIGGVASPNASANWFSAGSTLAQSSRRTLEDSVFGGREFSLIYTAIWQGREEASKDLLKRADDEEFKAWDWRPILSLARQYDVKCGLNYGLSRLTRAVSTPAPTTAQ
ncbi:MAG: hypothetical protein Q7J26_05120 [Brevundimonas sp.]|jgi:hypothetical protein|uniref:hypothetical protein n=1 Tax=Brevundimonas sp. TaxID=1871086 RepID=UPI002726988D|nr:hypothetical protein [Brevundimonas sp.]MDO9607882.1 hypothetical protein [Brevundimonas sp.]